MDTVVCLTLAKRETVSGQFGGYLTNKPEILDGFDTVDILMVAVTYFASANSN